MQSNYVPKVDCNFDNELHKIEKILTIYAVSKDKVLRGFEKLVLKYYLKYGFSPETKKIAAEDTGKRIEYINSINTHLRDKGFLVENKYKDTDLSPDMLMLRKSFVEGKKKLYVVTFQ